MKSKKTYFQFGEQLVCGLVLAVEDRTVSGNGIIQ
jgi:hypothetical protein